MSEWIRKQDAIDALKEYEVVESDNFTRTDPITMMTVATIAECIEAIVDLPSVESERKAKVIENDASVTDANGYKYHWSEYLCGACKKRVLGGDEYCSHCGAKIDWSGNE